MGLEQRPRDPQQRLVREDDRSLGDAIHVAPKAHLGQVFEKCRLEERLLVVPSQTGQIREILRIESRPLQVLHNRGQSSRHGETAAERVLAEEQVKHGLLVVPARLPITIGHR